MDEIKYIINDIELIEDKYVRGCLSEITDNQIIIVPLIGFRGKEGYTYPEGTTDFYNYLKVQSNRDMKLAFDDYYNENVMHHEWIRLAEIAVTYVLLPIVTGLIVSFITDKIKRGKKDPGKVKVELAIKVRKGSRTIDFNFEGDATKLEEAMKNIKDIANDDGHDS
ncbi:MAG: hypothetical protein Q7I99_06905 [Acholeplasmataceae bacterium]|nr:hypothetical protein [Acholeplasmataceae bacterium]